MSQSGRPKRYSYTSIANGDGDKHRGSAQLPGLLLRSPTLQSNPPSESTVSSEDDRDLELRAEFLHEKFQRSSPLRRSLDLDERSSTTDFILPENINCFLAITFNGKDVSSSLGAEGPMVENTFEDRNFKWLQASTYEHTIHARCTKVTDMIRSHSQFTNHTLYLRAGLCCVKGDSNETQSPDLARFEEDSLTETAIRAICRFISKHPYKRFELLLSFDYGSVIESPEPGQDFKTTMQIQYRRKFDITSKTILEQNYLSGADLPYLTSREISKCLIDASTELDTHEKNRLQAKVVLCPAYILLAVCVHAKISLKYLLHLLDSPKHSYRDDLDVLIKRAEQLSHCDFGNCKDLHHGEFMEKVYLFFPRLVSDDRFFHEYGPEEVVPISHASHDRVLLGEGAHSHVYEVKVDPAHRHGKSFTSDPSRSYALKVFSEDVSGKNQYRDAFRTELRNLLYLSVYSHAHILNHITSWEQRGTFYILYEKAGSNLRMFWKTTPAGDLSSERILWFFRQLRGMSDAVRRVHQLKEPTPSAMTSLLRNNQSSSEHGASAPESSTKRETGAISNTRDKKQKEKKKRSRTSMGIIGVHYDIKPENILVFDRKNQLPILKLSDFGAGKFSSVRDQHTSYGASRPHGTRTYFGPEYDPDKRQKRSRPSDMWALGCVFLEFLLWFLGMKDNTANTGKSFASIRAFNSDAGAPDHFDYFWQYANKADGQSLGDPNVTYKLKGIVSEVLELLEGGFCKDMPAFLNILEVINNLLKIDPLERLHVVDLSNKLDTILSQVRADLHKQPDSYKEIFARNKILSEPGPDPMSEDPTTQATEDKSLPKFPAQLSVMQSPSADISTIGTSRKRSVDDLKASESSREQIATGQSELGAAPDNDFQTPHLGDLLANPPDKLDLKDSEASDLPIARLSTTVDHTPVNTTRITNSNVPWTHFRATQPIDEPYRVSVFGTGEPEPKMIRDTATESDQTLRISGMETEAKTIEPSTVKSETRLDMPEQTSSKFPDQLPTRASETVVAGNVHGDTSQVAPSSIPENGSKDIPEDPQASAQVLKEDQIEEPQRDQTVGTVQVSQQVRSSDSGQNRRSRLSRRVKKLLDW